MEIAVYLFHCAGLSEHPWQRKRRVVRFSVYGRGCGHRRLRCLVFVVVVCAIFVSFVCPLRPRNPLHSCVVVSGLERSGLVRLADGLIPWKVCTCGQWYAVTQDTRVVLFSRFVFLLESPECDRCERAAFPLSRDPSTHILAAVPLPVYSDKSSIAVCTHHCLGIASSEEGTRSAQNLAEV